MSELKLPELFGSRVFNEETMKERLSGACYQAWKRCVTDGAALELSTANEIAGAMKDLGGGAWLHPLYPLVPAHDRRHGGEARQLHRPCRGRPGDLGIFRQEPGAG